MDRSLRRELKSTFGNNNYWFDTTKFKKAVVIKIKNNNKIIEFTIPKDKISTSSFRLFVYGLFPSVILILIAIVFLKKSNKTNSKSLKSSRTIWKR